MLPRSGWHGVQTKCDHKFFPHAHSRRCAGPAPAPQSRDIQKHLHGREPSGGSTASHGGSELGLWAAGDRGPPPLPLPDRVAVANTERLAMSTMKSRPSALRLFRVGRQFLPSSSATTRSTPWRTGTETKKQVHRVRVCASVDGSRGGVWLHLRSIRGSGQPPRPAGDGAPDGPCVVYEGRSSMAVIRPLRMELFENGNESARVRMFNARVCVG